MRSQLVSVCTLSLTFAACAQLVGISDTTVTRDEGAPGDGVAAAQGGSGGSGTDVTISPAGGAPAGSAGSSGSAGVPNAGGTGGTGEQPQNPTWDAGPDAGAAPCSDQATRCGEAVREVCSAGVWQASACPLNQPTCEGDGQCVVRGPALISVGNFFIDATEVTVGQYQQFLAAKNGDVSGQSAVCSWNQSYYEAGAPVTRSSEFPMTWVDWCDASAYCDWAGKRLCGRISGGPIALAELFDEDQSQWFVSCGGGGVHPNDNPNTVGNPRCNSSQGFAGVAAVATYPLCEGYYPGLFDMEGNVSEWVDACVGSAGASDVCYLVGGSTLDQVSYCDQVSLDVEDPWLRSSKTVYDGFRCCAG